MSEINSPGNFIRNENLQKNFIENMTASNQEKSGGPGLNYSNDNIRVSNESNREQDDQEINFVMPNKNIPIYASEKIENHDDQIEDNNSIKEFGYNTKASCPQNQLSQQDYRTMINTADFQNL